MKILFACELKDDERVMRNDRTIDDFTVASQYPGYIGRKYSSVKSFITIYRKIEKGKK